MVRYQLLILMLGWLMGTQVLAHSMLQASSPMDGAEMEDPRTLTLEFNEPVRVLRVSLTGPDGDPVAFDFQPNSEPAATLRYGLPTLQSGEYRVEWMLIGGDGHTVSEWFAFSVTDSSD